MTRSFGDIVCRTFLDFHAKRKIFTWDQRLTRSAPNRDVNAAGEWSPNKWDDIYCQYFRLVSQTCSLSLIDLAGKD